MQVDLFPNSRHHSLNRYNFLILRRDWLLYLLQQMTQNYDDVVRAKSTKEEIWKSINSMMTQGFSVSFFSSLWSTWDMFVVIVVVVVRCYSLKIFSVYHLKIFHWYKQNKCWLTNQKGMKIFLRRARAREKERFQYVAKTNFFCFGLFEFVFFLSVEDGKNSCSIDY